MSKVPEPVVLPGKIVHFASGATPPHTVQGGCYAAIVTRVWQNPGPGSDRPVNPGATARMNEVDLCVLDPAESKCQFMSGIPQSETLKFTLEGAGTWHWPENTPGIIGLSD